MKKSPKRLAAKGSNAKHFFSCVSVQSFMREGRIHNLKVDAWPPNTAD